MTVLRFATLLLMLVYGARSSDLAIDSAIGSGNDLAIDSGNDLAISEHCYFNGRILQNQTRQNDWLLLPANYVVKSRLQYLEEIDGAMRAALLEKGHCPRGCPVMGYTSGKTALVWNSSDIIRRCTDWSGQDGCEQLPCYLPQVTDNASMKKWLPAGPPPTMSGLSDANTMGTATADMTDNPPVSSMARSKVNRRSKSKATKAISKADDNPEGRDTTFVDEIQVGVTYTGAIGSWFQTDIARDNTNGCSWCNRPYNDDMLGFAPCLSRMAQTTKDVKWEGEGAASSEEWKRIGNKYCGRKATLRNPGNGRTVQAYISDAFEARYCKHPNDLDLQISTFEALGGPRSAIANADKDWVFMGDNSLEWTLKDDFNDDFRFGDGCHKSKL
ncbi:unnamed protein product [Sphagnum troendelagicum]